MFKQRPFGWMVGESGTSGSGGNVEVYPNRLQPPAEADAFDLECAWYACPEDGSGSSAKPDRNRDLV